MSLPEMIPEGLGRESCGARKAALGAGGLCRAGGLPETGVWLPKPLLPVACSARSPAWKTLARLERGGENQELPVLPVLQRPYFGGLRAARQALGLLRTACQGNCVAFPPSFALCERPCGQGPAEVPWGLARGEVVCVRREEERMRSFCWRQERPRVRGVSWAPGAVSWPGACPHGQHRPFQPKARNLLVEEA